MRARVSVGEWKVVGCRWVSSRGGAVGLSVGESGKGIRVRGRGVSVGEREVVGR